MLFFLWKENRRNSTVLDSFGKPLEGAKIQVLNPKFKAEINGSGKYAIDLQQEKFTSNLHMTIISKEKKYLSLKNIIKNLIVTFR